MDIGSILLVRLDAMVPWALAGTAPATLTGKRIPTLVFMTLLLTAGSLTTILLFRFAALFECCAPKEQTPAILLI
jgi:hypothetical protein